MRFINAPLVAGLVFCSSALAADRSQWNQWRGPDRTCVIAPTEWPALLDEKSLVEMYRVPLDASYSGPIVSADKVFVTETVNKEKEVVRALDRETGKEQWQVEWPGAMTVPFFAASNGSWIRSTPIFDGEKLYVTGMVDELVALEGATGKVVWRMDFKKEFGTMGRTGEAGLRNGCHRLEKPERRRRHDGRRVLFARAGYDSRHEAAGRADSCQTLRRRS